MNTRRARAKRVKLKHDEDEQEESFVSTATVANSAADTTANVIDDLEQQSNSSDLEDEDEIRKSRIRDSNKEFARRMTILTTWSVYWEDYSIREGEAYPQAHAKAIIKKAKKIACPIQACGKTFTSWGGLKYHYARCNIERSFKCKVCEPHRQLATRGELLRHMIISHYNDLPTLNDEQKEIANSILSHNRGDKKDKRSGGGDTEVLNNGPRLVKSYKDLVTRVFEPQSFALRPFKNWKTLSRDWELIANEPDRRRYYPPELESVYFKLNTEELGHTIKTGESMVLNKDKQGSTVSSVFFTGGINTASAWLPKPCLDQNAQNTLELLAIAVNCGSMDHNPSYRDTSSGEGCIQFWSISGFAKRDKENRPIKSEMKLSLSYMVGHDFGTVFDMLWCPLGASWQPNIKMEGSVARVGLLAVASGDGCIRILSVPHSESLFAKTYNRISMVNTLEAAPVFRVRPVACLLAPGVGSSTDYHASACKSITWNLEDNQRLIVAGYANGNVALFDLANFSPILYTNNDGHHLYRPLKSWVAHGGPVNGVAVSSTTPGDTRTYIATGSTDRQLKLWNPMDLNTCISTDRAPITKVLWDFRFRGVITATDTAFTSFNNRVSYRYPVVEGTHNVTVSVHRSTVWGLSSSLITSATATSDCAGEVFVLPQLVNRPFHKRDRNLLCTHSLYSMVPYCLDDNEKDTILRNEVESPEHMLGGDALEEQSVNPMHVEEINNEDAEEINSEGGREIVGEYIHVERPMVNKPSKFLLPLNQRSVETYRDFKTNYGLEFIQYEHTTPPGSDSKLPESCVRAVEAKDIFCDRPSDYPYSSVNMVNWSPNADSFSYMLSASHVGLCRIDRILIVEQISKSVVESTLNTGGDGALNSHTQQ